MDSIDDALDAQQELLENSLPAVFAAYDDAIAQESKEPVVILLDCEDAIGGEIARGWLGNEAVDDAIADESTEFETTVFARGYSWAECCREIPAVFPYLAPAFQTRAPSDGFLAVSVACGGASALTVPFDARPDKKPS